MRRKFTPATAFALLFLLIAALSAAKVVFRAKAGFGDHIAYYRAAERLMSGSDPYAATGDTYVYLYPPCWAVMVWPLTLGGRALFGMVWAGVLGAAWLVARRAVAELSQTRGTWALVIAELVLVRFLLGAWSSGQVTLPLGALCLGGLALATRGWTASGAALVGIAGSIKVYPFFLVVALARIGGRRAVGALVMSAAFVSLLPAAVCGPERFVELVRDGFFGSGMANLESQRWWSGRCAPLATAWHLAGGEAGAGLKIAEVGWAALLAGLVWFSCPVDPARRAGWLGFGVLSMLIATPMLGENYLALLVLPVAVLVARGGHGRALGAAMVLLNVHSPLIVGRQHCDTLERLGLSSLGLMVLWVALGRAVWSELAAEAASESSRDAAAEEMGMRNGSIVHEAALGGGIV